MQIEIDRQKINASDAQLRDSAQAVFAKYDPGGSVLECSSEKFIISIEVSPGALHWNDTRLIENLFCFFKRRSAGEFDLHGKGAKICTL